MSTLADLQSEVAALKAEVAQLREDAALFFNIYRDDDGKVTDSDLRCGLLRCEMIDVRSRNAPFPGVTLGSDEEGAYVSLWGTGRRPRAMLRVIDDTGEFELFGQDNHPVVRLFEAEGHGHVAVLSAGNIPRAVVKGMESGGTFTAVDDEGKPLAVLHSIKGKGGLVVLGDGQRRAEISSNAAGGTIVTLDAQNKRSFVVTSTPAGNTVMVSTPDGAEAVTLAGTVSGSILSVGSSVDNTVHGSVTISDLPKLGGGITIRDAEKREIVDLSGDADGGRVRVSGEEGAHLFMKINGGGGQFTAHHRNGSARTIFAAQETGGFVSAQGAEGTVGMHVGPAGGSLAIRKEDQAQFFAGVVEAGKDAFLAISGPDNTPRVRLLSGPDGGMILADGSDGTTQAGLGASDAGGIVTVFNEVGVERASLRSANDGGGLHLKWGGTTGLTAAATERGGLITAHGPDGQVVQTLPDQENFAAEDEEDG